MSGLFNKAEIAFLLIFSCVVEDMKGEIMELSKNFSLLRSEVMLKMQPEGQAKCKFGSNLISTPIFFVLLILVLCAFIVLLFLPSILELKRPKDPGPRKITENITEEDD